MFCYSRRDSCPCFVTVHVIVVHVLFQYGVNSNPWAPTQDYTWGFMPQSPKDYRVAGLYDYIPFMAGINVNDGAEMASKSHPVFSPTHTFIPIIRDQYWYLIQHWY